MNRKSVVFICLNDHENLGVGYLSAVLSGAGFQARIINVKRRDAEILGIIKQLDPVIVGFSIVFQYHLELFRNIILYLRSNGVHCHFTAGGHYASLRYAELFTLLPDLDSIVLFEGEKTIIDLVKSLNSGEEWRSTDGLAYLQNGRIITTRLRQLERDIDIFPYPVRSRTREIAFGIRAVTIIAGRGCIHNCSFCNTREFYRRPGGPLKRIRDPHKVVEEMEFLYKKKGCSFFFFLDDDFPLNAKNDHVWIRSFCSGLKKKGLGDRILWRICCRPDEVGEDIFRLMKKNGLVQVFLGIEDGTDEGLRKLNKNISADLSISSVEILRRLKLDYDFGFMLFQPSSSFHSITRNLNFLEVLCSSGYTPVTFLKLLPYYDTKIEKELIKDGRLKITPGVRDYEFQGESLNRYYNFIFMSFNEWLLADNGVVNIAKSGRAYYSIYYRYLGSDPGFRRLKRNFRNIVSDSNLFIMKTLRDSAGLFESGQYLQEGILTGYSSNINLMHFRFRNRLQQNLGKLLELPLTRISKING